MLVNKDELASRDKASNLNVESEIKKLWICRNGKKHIVVEYVTMDGRSHSKVLNAMSAQYIYLSLIDEITRL